MGDSRYILFITWLKKKNRENLNEKNLSQNIGRKLEKKRKIEKNYQESKFDRKFEMYSLA